MSTPQIPPRPSRSHQQHTDTPDDGIPQIPPRPNRKNIERSRSPGQENFPRSPFNELPSQRSTLTESLSQETFASGLPPRPPSVSLPSIGQEGTEYADIDYNNGDVAADDEDNQNESPKETRNVAGDLPLHAPTPSFSNSSAKKRVSTVTRTDSSQAAAAGIGKATTPILANDDSDPQDRGLKARVSFRTASAASTERPGSLQERPDSAQTEDDHGIPEIGQRVPMYPDAGDVQAPSPSPFQQQFPAGIGYHNSGIAKSGSRQHRRTPSGRDVLPPGSYGMHGHGVPSADRFEQDWYAKHPEALQKEEGEYGPGIGGGRGEFALSSDDLNKLVRETSSKLDPNRIHRDNAFPENLTETISRNRFSCCRPSQRANWIQSLRGICISYGSVSTPCHRIVQDGTFEFFATTRRIATTQSKFSSGSGCWSNHSKDKELRHFVGKERKRP